LKPTKGLTIFPKTVMASKEFVHLHLHTQFSLLDGAIKIKELPEYAQQLGYQAVAITDHGNLFGSYKFYTTLKGAGLKPIIGMEAYITKGSLKTKIGKGSEDNYTDNQNHHIVLIAKNDVGLKNLMKLSSIGFLEGFHYKPRIDLEVLNQHREGLICLTACLKGLPTYYAARGQEQEAERWLLKLLDIFGKEDLYVEIQHHWHLEEQDTANRILIKLARKHGLKLVATADVHYLRPEDKTAHMILTALQMKKTYQELLQSPIGQKLRSMELHFASPEEMWRRFENKFEGWEEALLNTLEVAEKVADKLEYFENKEYKMPVYEVPEGETLETYFRKLAIEGLKKRIKERGVAKDEKVYWERLEYEMDVISKMGFPGYFLIVQDFISWAKSKGIPVGPGRGCVLPQTNVMLGSGELKPIEKVEVGDFVLTHRGAVLPVLNKFVYDVEETLVKIEAGNEELTLTHDHKVLALKTEKCKVKSVKDTVCKPTCGRYCKEKPYKEYKLTWLPAEELKKGDFLVFPRQPSANKEIIFDLLEFVEKSPALRWNEKFIYYQRGTNKLQTTKVPRFIKFDHKLAKILGYFISEGYTKANADGGVVGFGFHIEEEEYAQEILSLFEEVFKVKGKIYKAKNRKALTVEFKTKIVAQFLRKLCGSRAANKKIPLQIVLNGKDEYVKTLIAYLFRGDGYAGKGSKTLSIKYSTVSKTLAYQLRLLLARFGFWASITVRKRKNKNWNPEYSVKLSGAQLLKWNETFEGFPIKIPQQRFFRNDSFFVDEKFIYVKVRKVEKVPYKGKVYDITVPIDHSYTTSAVAIHNSAGGSLVAYALGITDIDPIKHDLLFERFLNPDRVSMPDIDVDFSKDRREEVIEYVRQKYGRDNVSQIITYNVLKSKSVIRDVCRALGVPLDKADKLAKLIPQGDTQGSQLSLEEMTDWTLQELKAKYGERPDIEDAVLKFRKMINEDPTLQEVVEIGKKLDGLTRHTGFHAAGVVIAPQPLKELVPLYARKEKDKETKKEKFTVATQYDMGVLEEIGLLKMDFLGLKTLTELDRMKKMVKQLYGKDIDFAKLDYEDPKVYELLKSGRTTGVFQLESRGMQNLLKKLKPDRFDDIIAVLALYRPGPLKSGLVESFVRRKHGKEPITYDFPELEPILKETYGLCLTGDTEITLADGRTLTLEEIVKNNLVGLEVLSLDEETYKLKPSKVTRVFDNGIKEVYEIVLTNGLRIKATSDHKFLTPDGWKELKDLKPKEDLLAVPISGRKKINELLKDKELEKHINGEINFIPIKEITYKGKERVYDLEVEETHNFIGNGIVCHNCIYQEQIMKMSQVLAGFTPGEADTLRKGIGKKRCLTASTLVLLEDGSTVELLKLIENIEFQREGKVRCRFCNSDKTYKNGDKGSKKSFYCLNCRKTFTVEILDKPLKVLALNENLKFEPSKIIEVHRNGEDTVYRLKLRYSGTVEATDKHLFLTPEGWKPLKLLKKGEKIATPLTFSVKSSGGLTQKEAKLLGYLLGDGNLKDVVFYNSDEEILKDYMSLVKTLFPESEFKIYNNSNSGKVIYIHERNRKSSIRSIKKFLRSLGFKTQKAGDKFVPERIMTSEIATVSAFLGALWSTDGSIVIAKNYEYTELLTKSKTLALQVLLLLRRLGITAILKKKIVNYKGERRTYYRVEVRGKENLERFIETVGVHIVGKKQDKLNSLKRRLKDKTQNYKKETIPSYFCSKLFEVEEAKGLKKSELAREVGEEGGINLNLNVSPERFRKYALLVKEKELLKLCDAQIFWDTVEDIEFVGVKQTYDLTIENSNFVANACIVHNSDIIAKMKTKFIEGAVARGKDRKKIEELWNSIEKFASYSFNKSHSTAYAYLSFQTAFFKTYYPGVFFAVKLSTEENQNKFISLIKDAKLFGFELLPPDINKSDIHFTIEEKDGKQYIRYGLAKIKGVGEEAAKAIQEAKRKYGKFKSLADFIKKVDTRKVNKKVIEALIAAGAFDFTGESREELLRKVESQDKLSLAVGQNTLFAPKRKKKKIQNVEEFLEILKKERQLLGFYISGHPLDKYQYILEKIPYRIEDLHEEDISDIKLAGVVVDFKEKRTRSGKYMAVFNLIDKTGLVECVIFPETYEEYKTKLGEDQIVIIEGYVSVDPETENKKVIVKRVFKPEEFQQEVSVKIVLKEKEINDKNIQKLKKLFSQMADPKNGAPTKIVLRMDNGEIYEILLSPDYWILPNANNLNTLSQILPKRIILE